MKDIVLQDDVNKTATVAALKNTPEGSKDGFGNWNEKGYTGKRFAGVLDGNGKTMTSKQH